MIRYRPFLNTDPPALAELWRNQPPQRGLTQPMSVNLLDNKVLCKPFFDRQGLIVAEEDGKIVGFVHCLAGCSGQPAPQRGAVCLLLVAHHADQEQTAAGLLHAAEEYAAKRGCTELAFGGVDRANPYYLGFYGGSALTGALASDENLMRRLREAGYVEESRSAVLQCDLNKFRPVIDRDQVQVRRSCLIEARIDPLSEDWWEACTIGFMDRTQFCISPRNGDPWGSVTFWEMTPIGGSWGVTAMAVSDIVINEPFRRAGRATFLLGEAMRQLGSHGVSLVEVNVAQTNEAALGLFHKLGFHQVDEAVRMVKLIQSEGGESKPTG